ncbi:NUDIX domain-containing protein [Candidatus Saccharibacteria bacterium oral taxon 488]|nr:NUDIX domain-containing protein [Candidatus Saccharibacteria bacterium oral taxon 488]
MASKNIIHHYSSGGVIVKDNEVLIIESLQPAKEYSFPKGSIEPGEHSRDTAVREILEETGYHATILGFIDTLIYEFSTGDGHVAKEVSYYAMSINSSVPRQEQQLQPGENIRPLWVSLPKAFQLLTHKNTRQLLAMAIKMYHH